MKLCIFRGHLNVESPGCLNECEGGGDFRVANSRCFGAGRWGNSLQNFVKGSNRDNASNDRFCVNVRELKKQKKTSTDSPV